MTCPVTATIKTESCQFDDESATYSTSHQQQQQHQTTHHFKAEVRNDDNESTC